MAWLFFFFTSSGRPKLFCMYWKSLTGRTADPERGMHSIPDHRPAGRRAQALTSRFTLQPGTDALLRDTHQ